MKKILLLLSSILLATSLIACSPPDEPHTDDPTPPVTPEPGPSGNTATVFTGRNGVNPITHEIVIGEPYGNLPAPTQTAGWSFIGYYKSLIGGTWRDMDVITSSTIVEQDSNIYANFVPTNSKTANWSSGETFSNSLLSVTPPVINPLNYGSNLELAMFSLLQDEFYGRDINWKYAIEQGYAAYENDWSQVRNGVVHIDEFGVIDTLRMAALFPTTSSGENGVINGQFNEELARSIMSDTFTVTLRNDIRFENGDLVNSDVIEYSIKETLNPAAGYSRANGVHAAQYLNIKNGKAYLDGDENVNWSDVGFEKIDEFTFRITTASNMSLYHMVSVGIDGIYVVHPETYEASKTVSESGVVTSSYGTAIAGSSNLNFMSYGEYVVKSWSMDQLIVFNKNFEFYNAHEISYKSLEYRVYDNAAAMDEAFKKGDLDVRGLNSQNFNDLASQFQYFSNEDAYAIRLAFNNNKRGDSRAVNSIIDDIDFRKAVFHGIDRDALVNSAMRPDVASLAFLSNMHGNSSIDLTPYNSSVFHKDMLEELGLGAESNGFIPERAKTLFNTSYDRWVLEKNGGIAGIIEFDFVVSVVSQTYYVPAALNIKAQLETLFGIDKLRINVNQVSSAAYTEAQRNNNYDWIFDGMGGMVQSATEFLYLISYQVYGNEGLGLDNRFANAPGFGLTESSLEFDFSKTEMWKEIVAAQEAGIPLTAEQELMRTGILLETPLSTEDSPIGSIGGNAVAPDANGIWRGNVMEFAFYFEEILISVVTSDRDNFFDYTTSVLERGLFEVMAIIPLAVTRISTAYSSDVVVEWPEHSLIFDWGTQKHRYLLSDPAYALWHANK